MADATGHVNNYRNIYKKLLISKTTILLESKQYMNT
jgi:hypothetical protein